MITDRLGLHSVLLPLLIKSKDLPDAIYIENNIVSHITSNKCLGVLLVEKLTFETNIEYICKKGCAMSSEKN